MAKATRSNSRELIDIYVGGTARNHTCLFYLYSKHEGIAIGGKVYVLSRWLSKILNASRCFGEVWIRHSGCKNYDALQQEGLA